VYIKKTKLYGVVGGEGAKSPPDVYLKKYLTPQNKMITTPLVSH